MVDVDDHDVSFVANVSLESLFEAENAKFFLRLAFAFLFGLGLSPLFAFFRLGLGGLGLHLICRFPSAIRMSFFVQKHIVVPILCPMACNIDKHGHRFSATF